MTLGSEPGKAKCVLLVIYFNFQVESSESLGLFIRQNKAPTQKSIRKLYMVYQRDSHTKGLTQGKNFMLSTEEFNTVKIYYDKDLKLLLQRAAIITRCSS